MGAIAEGFLFSSFCSFTPSRFACFCFTFRHLFYSKKLELRKKKIRRKRKDLLVYCMVFCGFCVRGLEQWWCVQDELVIVPDARLLVDLAGMFRFACSSFACFVVFLRCFWHFACFVIVSAFLVLLFILLSGFLSVNEVQVEGTGPLYPIWVSSFVMLSWYGSVQVML